MIVEGRGRSDERVCTIRKVDPSRKSASERVAEMDRANETRRESGTFHRNSRRYKQVLTLMTTYPSNNHCTSFHVYANNDVQYYTMFKPVCFQSSFTKRNELMGEHVVSSNRQCPPAWRGYSLPPPRMEKAIDIWQHETYNLHDTIFPITLPVL